MRRDLDRGHVAVSVRWTEYPEREATLAIDLPRAEAAAGRLRELKSALNLSGEVTLELVARQPEVLVSRSAEATEIAFAELEPIVARAAAECRAMRAREGAALAADLLARLDRRSRRVPRSLRSGRRTGWCANATGCRRR